MLLASFTNLHRGGDGARLFGVVGVDGDISAMGVELALGVDGHSISSPLSIILLDAYMLVMVCFEDDGRLFFQRM